MPDEIQILLQYCTPHLKPIVITALSTGMHRGEILKLTWDDVDFDQGHITIWESKNGESWTAPMSELLAETLRHKVEWCIQSALRHSRVSQGVGASL